MIDVFSKVPYKIIDHQLVKTAKPGIILAGYLIDFDDFTMQTGGTVLVTKEVLQSDEVVRVIDRIEDGEVERFLTNPANGAKLAKAILSATFRFKQTSNFGHEMP